MYEYIQNILDNDKIKYLFIIYLTIYAFHKWTPSYYTLIALIVGVIIVYFIEDRKRTVEEDYVSGKKQKLKDPYLSKTRFLYLDPELVDFLYSIKEYQRYNPYSYLNLTVKIDDFLRLKRDFSIGIELIGSQYQIAQQLQGEIINLYHSFIYKIPHSPATLDKYHKKMDLLRKILSKHLDFMYNYMQFKQSDEGIHRFTKFIYQGHPEAYDIDLSQTKSGQNELVEHQHFKFFA